MPTVSPLTRSTLVILVLALGCLATALGGELVELGEPTVVSFPNGYDVVDHQGRVLKSLPESRAATVKAYRQVEGTKLYVSDWSWERFQSAQRPPNYIRSRGGQATPIAPDGEDLRLQAQELSAQARRVIAEGDFENGFRLLTETLELTATTFGADSLETGRALYQAADLMKDRGLYDVAEYPYVAALDIFRKQRGDDAVETATLRNNIGSLYENLGRFDEAEDQYLASKRSLVKTVGEKSIDVGIVLANLAGLYEKQERFAAEEVALLRALDLLITHRGTNDPQAIQLRGRLATLYSKFTDKGAPQDVRPPRRASAIDVAKLVFPSVYWITCYDSRGAVFATGSGFQVRENLVATNHHVVDGAHRIAVRVLGSDRSFGVRFIQHIDTKNDLVVLNVPTSNAPVLRIQPSGEVAIGTDVFAIGNPLGLEGTISQGIVSGFRDTGSIKLIQTTAPISSGNSGGPLVDSSGAVRGVVVSSLRKGQNLNFAVPSEVLTELLGTPPQRIPPQDVPSKRNGDNKTEQNDR